MDTAKKWKSSVAGLPPSPDYGGTRWRAEQRPVPTAWPGRRNEYCSRGQRISRVKKILWQGFSPEILSRLENLSVIELLEMQLPYESRCQSAEPCAGMMSGTAGMGSHFYIKGGQGISRLQTKMDGRNYL